MSTTIALGVALSAPPRDVFRALTDGAEHSRFTGATSSIDPRPGGAFSYFNGAISGTFVEVSSPTRLVQRLRAADWPAGVTATVAHDLEPHAGGARTYLRVREDGAPAERTEEILAGWSKYWEALASHLAERRLGVVRRFVEEYKNRHRWDAVDEFVAADCAVHIPLPGLPQGREGMRLNGRLVCTAFPDVAVTHDFYVAEGDIVVERAHARATHTGPLMDLPPTGRPVTWTELHAYRVVDGRIAEVWTEADFMGILAQLGAVEFPGRKERT